MAKSKVSTKNEEMVLVSFKLGQDLYKQLSAYAETQVDESGKQLSPSLGARRLMLEGLKRTYPKK